MIHNGIEYGLMQAYAEGFDIFRNAGSRSCRRRTASSSPWPTSRSCGGAGASWVRGSSISRDRPRRGSGPGGVHRRRGRLGRGTVDGAGGDRGSGPRRCADLALYTRFRSRREHTFAEKVLSAMRLQFGGHVEKPSGGGS